MERIVDFYKEKRGEQQLVDHLVNSTHTEILEGLRHKPHVPNEDLKLEGGAAEIKWDKNGLLSEVHLISPKGASLDMKFDRG